MCRRCANSASRRSVPVSGTSFANWVAKTANLLTDEFAVDDTSVVAIDLPVHWVLPVIVAAMAIPKSTPVRTAPGVTRIGVPEGGTFVLNTRRSPEECAKHYRLSGRVLTIAGDDLVERSTEVRVVRDHNELPLAPNRNILNIALQVAGVSQLSSGNSSFASGGVSFSVNGMRTRSNNFMIDGISNNDRYYGDTVLNQTGVVGVPATLVPMDLLESDKIELLAQQVPTWRRNAPRSPCRDCPCWAG